MRGSLVPWRERLPRSWTRFEEEMEGLMDRFLGRSEPVFNGEGFVPTVNVAETENELEVTVDLPGMKPEEFNIELKDNSLWISGEKTEEKEEKGKTWHRLERRYGEFRRVIPLTTPVKEKAIEAEYHDGVLTVKLPKTEEVKPKKIEVKH